MTFAPKLLADTMKDCLELAHADGQPPVCIAVADAAGVLLMLHRNINAPARSVRIAQAKAYTAVQMAMPTSAFQRRLINENLNVQDFMDPGYTSLPGGLPIFNHGRVAGGVGVSGRTPDQDEALAQAFIERLARGF